MASTSLSFSPVQALLGGLFLGTGSGLLMIFSGKIAGNSGALKSVVVGEFDGAHRRRTQPSHGRRARGTDDPARLLAADAHRPRRRRSPAPPPLAPPVPACL